jgi:hypothetical protein
MQKINEASLKWSHEENEKKLAQLKLNLQNEYDSKISDLNSQLDELKNEAYVSLNVLQ